MSFERASVREMFPSSSPHFASPTSASKSREAANAQRIHAAKKLTPKRVPFSQINGGAVYKPVASERCDGAALTPPRRREANAEGEGALRESTQKQLYADALVASIAQLSPSLSPARADTLLPPFEELEDWEATSASSEGLEASTTPKWLEGFCDRRFSHFDVRRHSMVEGCITSPQTPRWLRDAAQHLHWPQNAGTTLEPVSEPCSPSAPHLAPESVEQTGVEMSGEIDSSKENLHANVDSHEEEASMECLQTRQANPSSDATKKEASIECTHTCQTKIFSDLTESEASVEILQTREEQLASDSTEVEASTEGLQPGEEKSASESADIQALMSCMETCQTKLSPDSNEVQGFLECTQACQTAKLSSDLTDIESSTENLQTGEEESAPESAVMKASSFTQTCQTKLSPDSTEVDGFSECPQTCQTKLSTDLAEKEETSSECLHPGQTKPSPESNECPQPCEENLSSDLIEEAIVECLQTREKNFPSDSAAIIASVQSLQTREEKIPPSSIEVDASTVCMFLLQLPFHV